MADFTLILPSYRSASKRHERCVRKLVSRENCVVVEPEEGSPNICHTRCLLAERALETLPDYHVWIDDDSVFAPEAVPHLVQMARENKAIVGADYSTKEIPGLMTAGWGNSGHTIAYGPQGGLYSVEHVGFGLVAMPKTLLRGVQSHLSPVEHGRVKWPFFVSAPDSVYGDYPTSDVWFCRRAIAAGYQVFCDTRVRVEHEGSFLYAPEHVAHAQKVAAE